jgi:glutamate dehydrogenase (NAD(P)+)
MGGTVRCVATWDALAGCSRSYRKADGVVPDELAAISDPFGGIDPARAADLGYEVLPGDAWLEQDVDVLIPAALENQIVEADVPRISARVGFVIEGANGPTSPAAEAAMTARGIRVIPDLLANAGGVVCSYLEQVQSGMNYYWGVSEVLSKVDVMLTAAWSDVSDLAERRDVSLRDAALAIAVDRVAAICRDRGWV